MITISICDTAIQSACAYYRGLGVFSKLRLIAPGIHAENMVSVSWDKLANTDILFVLRPVENSSIKVMEWAKDFNIPVWIDFDDCLHEIMPDNPAYDYFHDDHRLENMIKSLSFADMITVSTKFLSEYYQKYMDKKIIVIPNAHNDYHYPFKKIENTVDFISWRGSTTHRQDLLSCAKGMFAIAEKYPQWAWSFVGNDIWFITDKIKNHFNQKEVDIINYYKYISDLHSAIHIVPLRDNLFNRSKSNISWIEGTYSGSAVIAPSFAEFEYPGILRYTQSEESFSYCLEKLINSKAERQKRYLESYDYIKKFLLLSSVNNERINIVEKMLDRKIVRA